MRPLALLAFFAALVPISSAGAGSGGGGPLSLGDKLLAGGDARGALFAYQDAVNAEPRSAAARVKLGDAYDRLHHPAQAIQQYELALQLEPGNADAQRALDRVSAAEAAPAVAPAAPPPASAAVPLRAESTASPEPAPAAAPAGAPQHKIYRLSPPEPESRPTIEIVGPGATPPAPSPAAIEYEQGVALMAQGKYADAARKLDAALSLDPRLAVAYTARGSARVGLTRYRDAADDYRAALALDPQLATAVYGLAECYRLLKDPAAADLYARYAESRSPGVREDLRAVATRRATELKR